MSGCDGFCAYFTTLFQRALQLEAATEQTPFLIVLHLPIQIAPFLVIITNRLPCHLGVIEILVPKQSDRSDLQAKVAILFTKEATRLLVIGSSC